MNKYFDFFISRRNFIVAVIMIVTISFIFSSCLATSKVSKKETSISKIKNSKTDSLITDLDYINDSLIVGDSGKEPLSFATKLLLRTINNYTKVVPSSPKISNILLLKGQTFYSNHYYENARNSYTKIVDKFNESIEMPQAMKMIAQTYLEEKQFEKAESWYKKLETVAIDTNTLIEIKNRLAETYFNMAQKYEKKGEFSAAILQYSRVIRDFPDKPITAAALYNSALIHKNTKKWSESILTFNKLLVSFAQSQYIESAYLEMAICYTELKNWPKAALTYLEMFKHFPGSPKAKDALFNASVMYEKSDKLKMAGKIMEKYVELWPKDENSPDILFKAGDLYGKLEDWVNVERVNSKFGKMYGKDKNRVIQAMCIVGVAYYNQKKYTAALTQFKKTIQKASKLENSKVNNFYAAKSQFNLGNIYQEKSSKIKFSAKRTTFNKELKRKNSYLKLSVEAYSKVSNYKLLDWTTQSLYKIAEVFEEFGMAYHKRERPKFKNSDRLIDFEDEIAQAVDIYLVQRAMQGHERNVQFGAEYKYEDEWTAKSRQQLTKLPTLAAMNFLRLERIVSELMENKNLNASNQIQEKIRLLQVVGPFQDNALVLFYKALELSVKYGVDDKYKEMAVENITSISYRVGKTYNDVVNIARDVLLPESYDPYDKFYYNVSLLTEGITEYENLALEALYKNIKIAQAYSIKDDEWILKSKELLTNILFIRAYCYESLAFEALDTPPYPIGATEVEKEAYLVQLEDLGYQLEERAEKYYLDILTKQKDGLASGKYLDMAYSRLYKMKPDDVASKVFYDTIITIKSGRNWSFTLKEETNWNQNNYDDIEWSQVNKGVPHDSINITGFSSVAPNPIWGGAKKDETYKAGDFAYFRRGFTVKSIPENAIMEFSAIGKVEIFINGKELILDSLEQIRPWWKVKHSKDFANYLIKGRNIIAVKGKALSKSSYGLYINIEFKDKYLKLLPKLPSMENAISIKEYQDIIYKYPKIGNFMELN